ncbi:hypothetical protein Ddye_027903 [Dipteronia dyeriana]|uniref:Uncharacterized protein n=1 Tax=Dipteronia dyeriana TaxID=168575 RepID=A0AAD9TQG2_9ROSI|nr:hypothetical protein Ddye_027903 [Dipteronia dyeriana]
MLFLEPNLEFLLNAKRILRCFELASGLRINFHKLCRVRIGKRMGGIEEWSRRILCKNALLPINYLGLPLGGRPSALAFWKPLLVRIENRLAPWKRKFLNKGGSLVLIKSVLSSIPTYYMSVFKIPVGIANKIEKFQRSFFWGDGLEKRKMRLVGWDQMCQNKKNGGLDIGKVLDKNNSLLAKWIWLFKKEKSSLWKKVLCVIYKCSTNDLTWDWKDNSPASNFVEAVQSLLEEGSKSAVILKDGLKVVVGSGDRARVWTDAWCDSTPLRYSFPRIYVLSNNKEGAVRDFGKWIGNSWVWDVRFRRRLFDWELDQ